MTDRWRLTVNADKCLGSGLCSANVPSHFVLKDGVSVPLADEIDPDDTVLLAAQVCPAEAIGLTRVPSGEVLTDE